MVAGQDLLVCGGGRGPSTRPTMTCVKEYGPSRPPLFFTWLGSAGWRTRTFPGSVIMTTARGGHHDPIPDPGWFFPFSTSPPTTHVVFHNSWRGLWSTIYGWEWTTMRVIDPGPDHCSWTPSWFTFSIEMSKSDFWGVTFMQDSCCNKCYIWINSWYKSSSFPNFPFCFCKPELQLNCYADHCRL